ncbi:MAG: DUF3996 domain-containing protein [Spirochaetales bacterium]|nr:DUF3996 domain-containing protein [Spirochaetales bacterium]
MKKIVFIVTFVLVFFISVFSVSALRLGLEFGNPTAVIIIRPEPFDIKVGYYLASVFNQGGGDYIHVSVDYRIVDSYKLIDFLHIFLGLGAYVQIYMDSEDFHLGARIPVGIQAFLLKNTFEVFLEIVPTVDFLPGIAFGGFQGYLGFTVKI